MEWLPIADVEEKPSNKSKRESCFERDEDLKESVEILQWGMHEGVDWRKQ